MYNAYWYCPLRVSTLHVKLKRGITCVIKATPQASTFPMQIRKLRMLTHHKALLLHNNVCTLCLAVNKMPILNQYFLHLCFFIVDAYVALGKVLECSLTYVLCKASTGEVNPWVHLYKVPFLGNMPVFVTQSHLTSIKNIRKYSTVP